MLTNEKLINFAIVLMCIVAQPRTPAAVLVQAL